VNSFAVLCTGPSLSQALADAVRHLRVIAVNGAHVFAPWAEALVANDGKWWACNPEAMNFAGRKVTSQNVLGLERLNPNGAIGTNTCSGVLALEVARRAGAQRILLLGADFRSGHFFGDYKPPLKNTTPDRREVHRKQFRAWRDANTRVTVLNCTPSSGLDCFVKVPLEVALHDLEAAA
jgi:hypothetical protein